MTKPLARQQVFRLTAEELRQVEMLVVKCNQYLEIVGRPLREASRLIGLGQVSDLVLNEVASSFQREGYIVEPRPATREQTAMIRLA